MIKQPARYSLRRFINALLALFQQYPLLFWGSIWSVTLFLIWIALASLTIPPVPPVSSPLPDRVVSSPIEPIATSAQPLNFWMFALIIVGCIIGSLLILKRWEPASQSRQPKRVKRQSRSLVKSSRPHPLALARTSQSAPRRSVTPVAGQSQPSSRKPGSSKQPRPSSPAQTLRTPVVTVVPPEETHPLDWGEAGLAEMMDIRKRRPRPTAIR